MRSAEFRKRLRIGVGAEQVHAAVVALVGLEAFENLLRVVQHGRRRIEREIGAGFDPRVMPALGLVVADDRHVIGEDPAEARVHELCRAVLLGRRIRRRLDFEFQAHFLLPAPGRFLGRWAELLAHELLGSRGPRLRLGAAGTVGLDFAALALRPSPALRPVSIAVMSGEDMLLRNAEVQYVCRNAARQSHGSQIRGRCRHRWLFPAA